MTGAELVAQARQAQPDLKAIIVSGYAELPEGAPLEVPRLAKPFGDADLANMIARWRVSGGNLSSSATSSPSRHPELVSCPIHGMRR
jgi:CheY-like chemotaxis protein